MSPSRSDLLALIDRLCASTKRTVEKRNAAYAGSGDVFGNLNMIETLSHGAVSTETGIIIRMADKVSRLYSLCAEGAPESDEKLLDTCEDLIGYVALLVLRHESRVSPSHTQGDPLAELAQRSLRKIQEALAKPCPPSRLPGDPLCFYFTAGPVEGGRKAVILDRVGVVGSHRPISADTFLGTPKGRPLLKYLDFRSTDQKWFVVRDGESTSKAILPQGLMDRLAGCAIIYSPDLVEGEGEQPRSRPANT